MQYVFTVGFVSFFFFNGVGIWTQGLTTW
jgi:hypothetical protein